MAWRCWRRSAIELWRYNEPMRSIFIVLVVANVLMFGLAQGWFGSARIEPGRQPAVMGTELNADAVIITTGQSQRR